MIVAYASDIHMEHGTSESDLMQPINADILILAGDIDSSPEYLGRDISIIRRNTNIPIIIVLGNHEFYRHSFPSTILKYKQALFEFDNVHLLERESVTIDGVNFHGATLWTNFCNGTKKKECQRAVSDFTWIQQDNTNQPITPDFVLQYFSDTLMWLHEALTNVVGEKNIVITHMAPSFKSQHPKFAGSNIAGFFCSNLEDLIELWEPQIWIHGHLHDQVNYIVGHTKILANPWGYPREKNQHRFHYIVV